MYFPGSRYETSRIVQVTADDGSLVSAVVAPRPRQTPVSGTHRCLEGQRLDHIAAHYLDDATAFWRLCDAANTVAPDALVARAGLPIPAPEV
jgi:hypothetical protein